MATAPASLHRNSSLETVLQHLHKHPSPTVPCPEKVPKRASVAVIIRIRPRYEYPSESHTISPSSNISSQIASYFTRPSTQEGIPEILFIKRASRKGDRWTGHVALPGGRRDPEDEDDLVTAIRETREEVGLDLLAPGAAIAVGNLPQRIVTTSWGRVPLMVLCPFVFLVTTDNLPNLRLQPTEVASAHWVSIDSLQSPELRSREYQDVSARLAGQETGLKRWLFRAMLGKMEYAAIRLIPSESIWESTIPGFLPEAGDHGAAERQMPPLKLWGLTLSVLADLLDMLPPHNVVDLWKFPTFTPWDVRTVVWLVTYRFRQEMGTDIKEGVLKPAACELGSGEVPNRTTEDEVGAQAGIDGLGSKQTRFGNSASALGKLLEEYYPLLRTGVAISLGLRATALIATGVTMFKYRRILSRYIQ